MEVGSGNQNSYIKFSFGPIYLEPKTTVVLWPALFLWELAASLYGKFSQVAAALRYRSKHLI